MNARQNISVILLCLGVILAFLPLNAHRSLAGKPAKLLPQVMDESTFVTADQVARLVVSEDKTVQLIDLRTPEEYKDLNIPGSINIPYKEFLQNDPERYLNKQKIRTIFYSNDDLESAYALTIARGLRYDNTFILKGGLNEWFRLVMNSSFSGEKITARENALFETRFRARKLFTGLNSLPDSMKIRYLEAKHVAAKKLDGGCE